MSATITEVPAQARKQQLLALCRPFLAEVKSMTPGSAVERWLNKEYGPGSLFYDEVADLVRRGVLQENWAADVEIDGPRYRRARLVPPSEETFWFSITSVYMDSTGNPQNRPDGSYRGDFHGHPYGEFNMVIPVDDGAALAGPNGWCHAGWTAPAPGSRHYPEAKGGAVIALFFLPAGRIHYPEKESQSC
ncbi:DUF4863 family protein [Bordetella flabilis]|uniref:DUF4863 domain-containing protein n=1 Tax=Bordetella flabilis TaxID=463014 RepID=A0A193GI57_9BORD|nr:DUF4863 family protein [Bordetella flabilis]ANN79515.1 DUF4863 domain-containing protein [Bordetella flabilis]